MELSLDGLLAPIIMEVKMKRPTMLVQTILEQLSMDLDLSVERDISVMKYRCEHEGFSFLSLTLPVLSDALLHGIETGTFHCPAQFSRSGRLPRFLGGFFKRVFNKDGRLLAEPCPYTLKGIRQVCDFFKKVEIECTQGRQAKAIKAYREVEGELRTMTSQILREDKTLDEISGRIWAQVFPELDGLSLVCHHSRGFTADRRLANARHGVAKWNERSESSFPSDLHCYPNYGVAADHDGSSDKAEGVEFLSVRQELGVRVVFVPKTLKAPRVIAMEPSHVQYMQQSVKDYIYEVLEAHEFTRRSIRFTDQSVNRSLAYSSSIDKRLATLDLKDASDRVHLELVQRIFKTSGLLPYLEDARSLHATLPDGRNMVLTKYASQGSALCFPVEAMVFYTLCQSAMHQLDGRRPSSQSIREYSDMIDIYGDDIIVPVYYADCIVRYLESYALKVNVSKSFRNSLFRESCGADFYNGTPVRPVYARKFPYDNVRSWGPEEIMSWVAKADEFYLSGQWHVAQVLHNLVRQVVGRPIPRTRTIGPGVAFFSLLFTTDLRWNADLQCWKQKRVQFQPINRKDEIDGDETSCLNKWGLSTYLRTKRSGDCTLRTVGRRTFVPRPYSSAGSITDCRSRVGQEYPRVDAQLCNCSVCGLQVIYGCEWASAPRIPYMAYYRNAADQVDSQPSGNECTEFGISGPIGLEESDQSWAYTRESMEGLNIKPEPLNFSSSVKRGGFKSKHRWVSLHS